jgi:hypothetical protein
VNGTEIIKDLTGCFEAQAFHGPMVDPVSAPEELAPYDPQRWAAPDMAPPAS